MKLVGWHNPNHTVIHQFKLFAPPPSDHASLHGLRAPQLVTNHQRLENMLFPASLVSYTAKHRSILLSWQI